MFKKSVESIIANFQRTSDQLTDLAQGNDERVAETSRKITALHIEKAQLQSEAVRARTIAGKLDDLLGE